MMSQRRQLFMLDLLKKVDVILKDNNIQYWLDAGTLLCAYRDGDLAHEHDIDIGIFAKDYEKVIRLNPVFRTVCKCKAREFRAKQSNILYDDNICHLLDFIVWHRLEKGIMSCLGGVLPFSLPETMFNSFSELGFEKLSSHKFSVPAKTKRYVEMYFGKDDWKKKMTPEEYTTYQKQCQFNLVKRPYINRDVPGHLDMWRKVLGNDFNFYYTSFWSQNHVN